MSALVLLIIPLFIPRAAAPAFAMRAWTIGGFLALMAGACATATCMFESFNGAGTAGIALTLAPTLLTLAAIGFIGVTLKNLSRVPEETK